ncbi:MAG TPA: cytochrome c maturation protein CcmE [Acidimicrobiales bacterium]|nr:cytochrome c maturation protein CcmE [Acidimicrobiales bacterium]
MTSVEQGGTGPELDLTPRTKETRRRRGLPAAVLLVVVVAALGFIAVKALGDASLFFLNVDEAVEDRADLGDDRFRMQGTVVEGSVVESADGVSFEVEFNDVRADVVHQGDPPELFQPRIPVVLEGSWDGEVFASDRILVKHSSEYEAENEDRLREADEGGREGSSAP